MRVAIATEALCALVLSLHRNWPFSVPLIVCAASGSDTYCARALNSGLAAVDVAVRSVIAELMRVVTSLRTMADVVVVQPANAAGVTPAAPVDGK